GRKVDHRADVFSVGPISNKLLAHRKPFDGETLTGVMFKIMHEEPDPGLIPASDYTPGLERIVMKALARSVEERYQSLDEMHEELAALVRETAGRLGAVSDMTTDRPNGQAHDAEPEEHEVAATPGAPAPAGGASRPVGGAPARP